MKVLTVDEVDQVSGAADPMMIAAGLGLVIAAISAAPLLTATTLGWAFGAGVAYMGGAITGTGAMSG